jgi:F0F1-type ATP synthase assembly protein I
VSRLEEKTRNAYQSVKYTGLGIELGVFIAVGVFGGNWIDEQYGTAPWGILGGVAFGIAGGVRTLYRTVKQIQKSQEEESGESEK